MAPQTPTTSTSTADSKPIFSERETRQIIAAFLSLKSGAPEIDYQRFQKNGEFNTLKTAQNTWGLLKKKIMALNPEAAESAGKAAPTTPKTTSRKRTKKESYCEDADEVAEEGSASKKPKLILKNSPKSTSSQADEVINADAFVGDGSPKKRTRAPRKTPAKKAASNKGKGKAKEVVEEPTTPVADPMTTPSANAVATPTTSPVATPAVNSFAVPDEDAKPVITEASEEAEVVAVGEEKRSPTPVIKAEPIDDQGLFAHGT